jgi:hypothetical protein
MPLIKGLQGKIEAVLVQMQKLLHLSWRKRMKNLRQLCAAVLLTLAFALSAYADDGHVPCGLTSPASPEAKGIVDCPTLTDAAVSIIQSVLSLS